MNTYEQIRTLMTRRHFFGRTSVGIGTAALASLLGGESAADAGDRRAADAGLRELPHFAPQAKRVIYLHQNGAPSQMDLLDHKPQLENFAGEELPDSIRMGQRLTGMTSRQESFPVAASMFKFAQHGECGAWISELLPHTAGVVDRLCIIKSMYTEAINHDPAVTFIQTGSQQPGRPSMGAWVSYGLGSENRNLPSFVVMTSRPDRIAQPLFARLWGSGFVPSKHQGVKFRGVGDPVLYLSNPAGIDQVRRRRMLDGIARLNELQHAAVGDPEIATRIAQYELAFRMQTSVPGLMDISGETEQTLAMYGPDVRQPGTYASNCLLARRLAERGVRFIQLYHRGWDQHRNLPRGIRVQCQATDQPTAALVKDLAQRGLLEETLVLWAGEFGRTVYCQGKLTEDNYGRDHHPRCFSIWMAGGGIQGGLTLGKTDDYCYNVVEEPTHVHDLQATVLHCLGIDHKRLTYRFQGRDHRLTDVHGNVIRKALV